MRVARIVAEAVDAWPLDPDGLERRAGDGTIDDVLSEIGIVDRLPRNIDMPLISLCLNAPGSLRRVVVVRYVFDANVVNKQRMRRRICRTLQKDKRVQTVRLKWMQ